MSASSPENAPASPCVRNCCLDEQDVCLGCKRTLQEILDWHRMTDGEKRQLLAELARRQSSTASTIEEPSPSKRCFLGFAAPAPIREQLRQAAATWRKQPETAGFRWIVPDNYHLTLAFLGHLPGERVQQLTDQLGQERWLPEDFQVKIEALIGFPRTKQSRYLVAQVEASAALLRVHERLQELLLQHGFPTEQRPLRPHITLARLRRGQRPPLITPQPLRLTYPVSELILYESRTMAEGASYQALRSFR